MSSNVEVLQGATVKEVIVAVLRAIRDSQKKLKVKTSKYLKQLEEFLFKLNNKKISDDEFRLLLIGNEEMGLKYGLLYCCGSKSKIDSNLRKSSYYSVKLLVQILEKHPQRKEFLNIYCDLEEDDFKQMNLSTHILSDNQNDMAAFELIRLVKDRRPHISLSTIVDGRRVIEKFEQWYKDYKKVQVEEEIKQTTWVDEDGKHPKTEDDVMKDQRDEKRKKKKKLLEHIQLDQSDQSADFRIKTFQDPLAIDFEQNDLNKSKNQQRESAQKKKQISNLMTLQVNSQSNIDLIRKKLMKNGYVLEDSIFKLHIDSNDFDPYFLIQSLHSDTPNTHFIQVISKLQNECMESKNLKSSLLYFFFEDLFILNNGITKLQLEFVKRENDSYQQRKRDSVIVVEEDLILGRLKLKNLTLYKELNEIANNLNAMKKNQFQLRQCLVFLQKFQSLVKLPQDIKKAYVQKDYQLIVFLYQQNKHHIKKFKNLSIFSQLFQEINNNLILSFKDVISQIKNEINNFKHLCELVTIILDLPTELHVEAEFKINLKELYENENGKGKQIHPNAFLIIQAIFNQLVQESSQYLDNEAHFEYSTKLEETQIEKVQGDMVSEFLVDMGVVVKKTEKKKAGKNAVVLNCKAVEKYFQNTFLPQFSNFYSLSVKFISGELDYRMGIQKLNVEQESPIQQIQYAPGSSQQWKDLISLAFGQMVDRFLVGFESFMKRLQKNWFEDEEVGKESLQFYNRVKSDLQSMSSVLFHYEQILLATKFQIVDSSQQKVLEKTKQLKTDMQVLFMKILFEEYRNITLNALSLEETIIPQQDFFGVQVSTYVTDIFDAIMTNFSFLGKFALHEGLFDSNCDLFTQYLVQLLQQALFKVRGTLLIGANSKDINQEHSIRRTKCLIFLHNLRIILPQSKSGILDDLVENIHQTLSANFGRQSEYSTTMNKILNSLSINQRQSRRQSKIQISVLYGSLVSPHKFQETICQIISKLIDSIYQPTLQLYISYLIPEFINPMIKQLPQVPRPYVYVWLDNLNQQVSQASLLYPVDPFLMDTLSSFVLTQFSKIIQEDESTVGRSSSVSNITDIKQSWKSLALDIQFFESVTVRMHGKLTKDGIEKLYHQLRQVAKVDSLEDLFDQQEDLQTRQDLLRNARYKMQYNFKALFAYF